MLGLRVIVTVLMLELNGVYRAQVNTVPCYRVVGSVPGSAATFSADCRQVPDLSPGHLSRSDQVASARNLQNGPCFRDSLRDPRDVHLPLPDAGGQVKR